MVMNSNCKRHLNALGIKKKFKLTSMGFYEPQLMKYALSPNNASQCIGILNHLL